MKKFILIPDSFKGNMSSLEICQIMNKQILKWYPNAHIMSIPVADGGEGTVDAFLTALGGKKIYLDVEGPFGDTITSFYGMLPDKTAVIEMAAAAGLPLAIGRLNPMKASTYGVGQLMLNAAENSAKKIIMGLGGSATNDGGTGAAYACGVKFFDKDGKIFKPIGESLKNIEKIDVSGIMPKLKEIPITVMCDIDNPLYGENGAAHIFAPQKGATRKMVNKLDFGLIKLSEVVLRDLNKDISAAPGAGAAGGMGGGMLAFWNSSLESGIDTVLNAISFEKLIEGADMILTGEGKIDNQSLRGKVVIGVAKRAANTKVPVVAIVGDIGDNMENAYTMGVTAIFSINRIAADFDKVKIRAKSDLELTMDNLMRFCRVMRRD